MTSSVIKAEDFAEWTLALRFEVNQGKDKGYAPYRLSLSQMERIATGLLKLSEWGDATNVMPTSEPYAYLVLMDGERKVQTFGLDRDELTIGRNLDTCRLLVPERYGNTSRQHARIVRTWEGVFIEDLGSKNGTYVNGIRASGRTGLYNGDRISLGHSAAADNVAVFVFSLRSDTSGPTFRTATGEAP